MVANAPAAVHQNEQALNTTAPPSENEDEALKQEVYEILKRHHPFTSSLTRQRASNPSDLSPTQQKLKKRNSSKCPQSSPRRISRTTTAKIRSK